MRLKNDVRATRANEALRGLVQALENLRGAGTTITDYASWVNQCERGLQEVLSEPDLSKGLHSVRFWQLFAHDPLNDPLNAGGSIARWNAALYAEIDQQHYRLRGIQHQLDELISLGARDGLPVVYDTNSLMHYESPDAVRWDQVVDGPVRLIVPLVVVDELDRKRYSATPKMAGRARAGQRALQDLIGKAAPGAAVPIPKRAATIEILVDEPGHVRAVDADDEIIERSRLLQQIVEQHVVVLTHDVGLQVRARVAGLDWIALPDQFSKPEVFAGN